MPFVRFVKRETVRHTPYGVGTIVDIDESMVKQLELLGYQRNDPIIERVEKPAVNNMIPDILGGQTVLIRN